MLIDFITYASLSGGNERTGESIKDGSMKEEEEKGSDSK